MLTRALEAEPAISLGEMKSRLADSGQLISERSFAPNETTRISHTYFLPELHEGLFPWNTTNYQEVIAKLVNRGRKIRVLDLGCGAGFWMEETAKISPLIETFGITAKDYRMACQRPLVKKDATFHHRTNNDLVFLGEHGLTYFSDVDLLHDAQFDEQHYLIGDAHQTLLQFPANFFDLIVSNQACKYFFDPLRVLKQVRRTLQPRGYAFLESMNPQIHFDRECEHLPDSEVEKILRRSGLKCNLGEYTPDGLHLRRGLAFKKTQPHISLPIKYLDVAHNPGTKTDYMTYSLVQ